MVSLSLESAGLAGVILMQTYALSHAEILESVERSLQCASRTTGLEMKRGLCALAGIATTAPLIGMFGTVVGLLGAFRGCIGQKWFCTMMILEAICEALVSTIAGLLVAIPAAWFYNYLSNRMELFNIEMQLASLELLNYLSAHRAAQSGLRR